MQFTFPSGVVIFFRHMDKNEQLARSVHPNGRNILMGHENSDIDFDDYIIVDENSQFVALYPREYVAAIMPIVTEGPASADNRPKPLAN